MYFEKINIDLNNTKTTSGVVRGVDVDLDHTGIVATSQTLNIMALNVALNTNNPTMVGTVNNYGIYRTHWIISFSGYIYGSILDVLNNV